MKFEKSFLSLTGLVLLLVGLGSTLVMWLTGFWLTFLFPYLAIIGVVLYLVDIPIRKSKLSVKQERIIQLLLIINPFIIIFIKTQIIDPRAEVILIPKNFAGPYIIIYGISGQPKLPRNGRDIIVRVPFNRILLTSTTKNQTSFTSECYVEDGMHKYGTKTNYLSTYNGTSYSQEIRNDGLYFRAGFYHDNVDTFRYDTLNKWTNNILDSISKKIQ